MDTSPGRIAGTMKSKGVSPSQIKKSKIEDAENISPLRKSNLNKLP